jgi:hypothetical protein
MDSICIHVMSAYSVYRIHYYTYMYVRTSRGYTSNTASTILLPKSMELLLEISVTAAGGTGGTHPVQLAAGGFKAKML